MPHYTCDACHYIFRADEMPDCCPSCHNRSVFAKNSTGKQFNLPAVRLSTEYETEQSRVADEQELQKQSFKDCVKSLSNYELSDNEYHASLMLIFFLKSVPAEYAKMHLGDLLSQRNNYLEGKAAETKARNLYDSIQKHFRSSLGCERRKTGCNDAIEVASYAGDESAASLLVQFRQSATDQILGKTPNLTDIRNVKFDEVIKEPGDGYIQFLMDWYNSIG